MQNSFSSSGMMVYLRENVCVCVCVYACTCVAHAHVKEGGDVGSGGRCSLNDLIFAECAEGNTMGL